MPNYAQHADKMSAKQYIEKVKIKELYDPVLSFQLANDFYVRKLLTGYLSGDRNQWNMPRYWNGPIFFILNR
jgi:hypothetical protein